MSNPYQWGVFKYDNIIHVMPVLAASNTVVNGHIPSPVCVCGPERRMLCEGCGDGGTAPGCAWCEGLGHVRYDATVGDENAWTMFIHHDPMVEIEEMVAGVKA